MEISYLGHSAFKLRGKNGAVVTDPYASEVGWSMPKVSADLVTVSHQHSDHNYVAAVAGTARRPQPFIISEPGEYELGGISVFGYPSFHDQVEGAERGSNNIYLIIIDELRCCHLGDLGTELTSEQLSTIGLVDILFCPIGGKFTIDPKTAMTVINQIEPSYVLPMHFRTDNHQSMYQDLATLSDFTKEYGASPQPETKLVVEKSKLPEETTLVILSSGQE